MSPGLRRWGPTIGLAVAAGGLLWCGWRLQQTRRDRRDMAEIREAIQSGLNGAATRRLTAYLAARPSSDEAAYLLGSCELARGRVGPAAEAWARIPQSSRFAARAILGRIQIEMGRGRQAEAERLVKDALEDPQCDASSLPILLGPIYCQQGRVDEAQQLIEARWNRLKDAGEGASESAIELVRLRIELRRQPMPIDVVRAALDESGRLAPDDDRVWLGKANLAVRTGSFDEAARWLDACVRRRPGDVAVWRSRLEWAAASRRVPEAREAMGHLPVAAFDRAEIPRLAAWLAAQRADAEAERSALERLIAIAPADVDALDRLALLATQQGQDARAADLGRQKAELDRVQARFDKLYRRNQPTRDAAEMSGLADRLGLRFEARAYATVAAAADPDREDLRRRLAFLDQQANSNDGGPRTLAEALEAEPDAVARRHAPAPTPAVR